MKEARYSDSVSFNPTNDFRGGGMVKIRYTWPVCGVVMVRVWGEAQKQALLP